MRTAVPKVAARNPDLAGRDPPLDGPSIPLPRLPKAEAFEMPGAIEVVDPTRDTRPLIQRWRQIASPTSARTITSSPTDNYLEGVPSAEVGAVVAMCDELRIEIECLKFDEIRIDIEILKDDLTTTEQKLQVACDEASGEHDRLLNAFLPVAVQVGLLRPPAARRSAAASRRQLLVARYKVTATEAELTTTTLGTASAVGWATPGCADA